MKKVLVFLLCLTMLFSLVGCGSSSVVKNETSTESQENESLTESESVVETTTEEEDDLADLEAIGDVVVEKGILFVKVTVPAEMMDGTTQEDLDAGAGENYTSAVLNDDGSVTYKMTKAQHASMIEYLRTNMEDAIKEIVDDDDNYSISDITYNDDFTEFDVIEDGTEVGLTDSMVSWILDVYGGMWGIFTGNKADNIKVNYYDPDGNLIESGNSADME